MHFSLLSLSPPYHLPLSFLSLPPLSLSLSLSLSPSLSPLFPPLSLSPSLSPLSFPPFLSLSYFSSEVLQWKADKVRTPAKRGRKPGTGKKNMIKGVTGKIILVTVDLSRYDNGSIFFQVRRRREEGEEGKEKERGNIYFYFYVQCLLIFTHECIVNVHVHIDFVGGGFYFLCICTQNGFCQAYHGISRCIECSSVSGDYPSSRYCRFLEFRK